MPERDVLPNITDPTLIPIGQPAATPPVTEESKGIFTTIAENRLIVIIVIIVIIAIGLFAYFVAYKGTDKEEIAAVPNQPQQKQGGFGTGQQNNGFSYPMGPQQQFMQSMQSMQSMQNGTQQQPQQFMNVPQNTAQQPQQQQPQQSQPEIKQLTRTNSTKVTSAIDLLNKSKNSMMNNMHDNVKNLAMQNVVMPPASRRAEEGAVNEIPKTEHLMGEGRTGQTNMQKQDRLEENVHSLNGSLHDVINDTNGTNVVNYTNGTVDVNEQDDTNDEKLMNNMLGVNENNNLSGDDSDLDKRFEKAFDLQQENLSGSSAPKSPSQIAHCEYIVQGRYCKLPVQYGNKCHKHYDK